MADDPKPIKREATVLGVGPSTREATVFGVGPPSAPELPAAMRRREPTILGVAPDANSAEPEDAGVEAPPAKATRESAFAAAKASVREAAAAPASERALARRALEAPSAPASEPSLAPKPAPPPLPALAKPSVPEAPAAGPVSDSAIAKPRLPPVKKSAEKAAPRTEPSIGVPAGVPRSGGGLKFFLFLVLAAGAVGAYLQRDRIAARLVGVEPSPVAPPVTPPVTAPAPVIVPSVVPSAAVATATPTASSDSEPVPTKDAGAKKDAGAATPPHPTAPHTKPLAPKP